MSIDLEARAKTARAAVRSLLEELAVLIQEARESGGYEAGFERLKRWKVRAVARLRDAVHSNEGDRLEEKEKRSWRIGDPIGNLVDEGSMYAGFLEALDRDLEEHPADILAAAVAVSQPINAEVPPPPNPGSLFIVHGHDELNLLRLKELVRDRWKLSPVVMSSEPGKGRHLIEKFEEEAQRAQYAFVLLTPDDVVGVGTGVYAQARPNVLFELGW